MGAPNDQRPALRAIGQASRGALNDNGACTDLTAFSVTKEHTVTHLEGEQQ